MHQNNVNHTPPASNIIVVTGGNGFIVCRLNFHHNKSVEIISGIPRRKALL
ncbi:hypothetical protein RSAG8_11776, partial [Rhizoctonia solani AG-8 WAC10335]